MENDRRCYSTRPSFINSSLRCVSRAKTISSEEIDRRTGQMSVDGLIRK